MTEWDGTCSVCGRPISEDERVYYSLDEYDLGTPAYCKECYEATHNTSLAPVILVLLAIILFYLLLYLF